MKVKHVLMDGTVLNSIEGYEIPYNEYTKGYYSLSAKMLIEEIENRQKKRVLAPTSTNT